ncbi:hypothetical protein PV11_08320 [Exophiala sideris]|uniref:FHA domain-containing protein n=1 Tax=Exophiala sideris TaxID=1016849 RepID=A0A0D1YIJ3_9EURO|nr:hypothetical protein PV11_08320 [Exophiala sideris]
MSKRGSSPSNSTTSSSSTIVNQVDLNLPRILSSHSSQDCYFDIKITQAAHITFHGNPAYQLQFKLDFARPFDPSKRIRSAAVDIQVTSSSRDFKRSGPVIVGIDPEASLVDVADHEVSSGQNVGVNVGAPGPAAGAISANAGLTWGDKTTFKGARLSHGYLLSSQNAQWKMYEEPKSQSGLFPYARLMVIVESETDFCVTANVRVRRRGTFGWVKDVHASASIESPNGHVVKREFLKDASQSALEVSDNITKLLKEGEERMQLLDRVVDKQFPNLNFDAIYGHHVAILKLKSVDRLFSRKEMNIPFDYGENGGQIIGRQLREGPREDPRNGVFKAQSVSQRHAQVWADEQTGLIYIQDLKSRGGTFVNAKRLSSGGTHELHKGDQLRLGTDILDDDRRSIKHSSVSAKVVFAGLTKPKTKEVELRKKAAQRDVDNKFEIWRMGARKEDDDMLDVLEDVVNHRLETLDIDRLGMDSEESDAEEDEEDEDEEDDEGDHYVRRRVASGVDDDHVDVRPSQRSSKRFHERSNILRKEPDWFEDSLRVHPGDQKSTSRSRTNACSAKLFVPKVQTGEEALANHRTVGRDWKEVKL